jgi:glycosyltransferase involved in cell wall biosynthesis
LKRSLSLVLPVRNAEATLAANVRHLCEVLSDLTDWFEVLLVDGGSHDHTVDIAYELAVEYPQVRVIRRQRQFGESVTVRLALEEARGDIVLLHERPMPLGPTDLRRLWEAPANDATSDATLVLRRMDTSDVVRRLETWGRALPREVLALEADGAGPRLVRRQPVTRRTDAPAAGNVVPPPLALSVETPTSAGSVVS